MERIHVLFRVDRVDHRLLGDMLRHRHLAQDARNLGALVELRDQAEQLLLGGFRGKRILLAIKAAFGAGFLFIADVNLAGRVVAHDDNRKAGRNAFFFQRLGLR